MKRLLAIILTITMVVSMTMLTGCGEKELAGVKADTIGTWNMSTEQEAVFEKVSILLDVQGQFFQFNTSKECSLQLHAYHYIDGKLVEDGDIADYTVNGDGYLYVNYADSAMSDIYGEMMEEDEDAENTAIITTSIVTDENEDGMSLEFTSQGIGSVDTMISLVNSDDTWESETDCPIKYEEEFDLWGINLSDSENPGDLGETVSATKKEWMKGECLIITGKFTEMEADDENAAEGEEEAEGEGVVQQDFSDELSDEEVEAIMKELEEADVED